VLSPCPFCGNATTDIGIQGSVRGRPGIAFDRVLLYATGGVAIADITNTYDTTAIGGAFASIGGTRRVDRRRWRRICVTSPKIRCRSASATGWATDQIGE
jgi:opacity protein-like surface antigen